MKAIVLAVIGAGVLGALVGGAIVQRAGDNGSTSRPAAPQPPATMQAATSPEPPEDRAWWCVVYPGDHSKSVEEMDNYVITVCVPKHDECQRLASGSALCLATTQVWCSNSLACFLTSEQCRMKVATPCALID